MRTIHVRVLIALLCAMTVVAFGPATAEAKNRKPFAVCLDACPGEPGRSAVGIYYDTDADSYYDKFVITGCDGVQTTFYGNWNVVAGDPPPSSGPWFMSLSSDYVPLTELYRFTAVFYYNTASGPVEDCRIEYDGATDGEHTSDCDSGALE